MTGVSMGQEPLGQFKVPWTTKKNAVSKVDQLLEVVEVDIF